jgi:hypothetical protein
VLSVLLAEFAILVHLKPVGVILLVFSCDVVALLALCAGHGDFYSHNGTSQTNRLNGQFLISLPRRLF